MDHTSDAKIRQILTNAKSIAVVGMSANRQRPSFEVAQYLQSRGYRILPVNPGLAGQRLLGETVYARLKDIPLPIDMVDIFRDSAAVAGIVDEAMEIGVKFIWMQLGVRDEQAANKAESAGIVVVMDRCPKIELAHYPTIG